MKDRKKYSYLGMLTLSSLLVVSAWLMGFVRLSEDERSQKIPLFSWQMEVSASATEAEGVPLSNLPKSTSSVSSGSLSANSLSANSLSGPSLSSSETEQTETEEESKTEPVVYQADTSWFEDTLFIGDSRTVGLHQYGDLGGAEVIADAGMNVYQIYDKEFTLSTGEKKYLEEVLKEQQFGKVYVMLGINELGYDFERTVQRYKELIEKIRSMQPDALLFIEANLHITAKKSENSPIFNNENINRFNEAIRLLADGQTSFYLDINERFDDEDGALSTEYTVDNAHVLGKYYANWVEWILQHAIRME